MNNDFSPYIRTLQSDVPTTAVHLNSSTNPHQLSSVDPGLASFIVTFPVLLVLAIAGYRNYRSRLLRSQILMLERIWHLKTQKHH
ncbi:hypothetical protein [Leptodesmis sichuanensis]|uniref:hypothetical protein n=1 Tax=Leptodesmis sichuanensis TaxID=2906798 RepID=UPI001F2870F6|nr:hypothetical protein [Leptodesmis sichuanensis]UIE37270.1 hypothetical protein KIK02_20290 [Leptodesmis sichuanensis A121]